MGVTGGETFMLPWLPETLAELSAVLPTVVLTNATLFTDAMLDRVAPLAGVECAFQISLDSDQPARNDEFRGPHNFAKVMDAIPKLRDRGIRVRIATTVEDQTEDELARLCRSFTAHWGFQMMTTSSVPWSDGDARQSEKWAPSWGRATCYPRSRSPKKVCSCTPSHPPSATAAPISTCS